MPKGICSIEGCAAPRKGRQEYCTSHYARLRQHGDPLAGGPYRIFGTLEERFWPKVNKNGPVPECRPDLGQCWLWTAAIHTQGYGVLGMAKNPGGHAAFAHRLAYELLIGPIPDGLVIDHLCRTRRCCNPAHLEPVTLVENTMRGDCPMARHARATHCPRGHEYNEQNTYVRANGHRQCRVCNKEDAKAKRDRLRAERLALASQ